MATRPILATYYRRHQPITTSRYARITTAFPKALTRLLLDGEPGDVVEFAHAEYGFQIGTVKIHTHGRLTIRIEQASNFGEHAA